MKLRAPFQKVLSEGIDVYQSQTDEKVIPLGKKINAKGFKLKKNFKLYLTGKVQEETHS